jgi:hypothetical protein
VDATARDQKLNDFRMLEGGDERAHFARPGESG